MKQEDCSYYVEETHHHGCTPEGESDPPPLLHLHVFFSMNFKHTLIILSWVITTMTFYLLNSSSGTSKWLHIFPWERKGKGYQLIASLMAVFLVYFIIYYLF